MNELVELLLFFLVVGIASLLCYKISEIIILKYLNLESVEKRSQYILTTVLTLAVSLVYLVSIDMVYFNLARYYAWKIDISINIFVLVFVIPFFSIYDILKNYVVSNEENLRRRWIFAVSLYLVGFFLFTYLFNPSVEETSDDTVDLIQQELNQTRTNIREMYNPPIFFKLSNWIQHILLRKMGIIGITLIAALSGTTVIIFPFDILKLYYLAVDPSGSSSEELERRLRTTKDMLVKKNRELFSLREKSRDTQKKKQEESGGVLSWFGFGKSTKQTSIGDVKQEIKTYENLIQFIELEQREKVSFEKTRKFTRSFWGKVYKSLGFLFAGFAFLRVSLCAVRVVFHITFSKNVKESDTGYVKAFLGFLDRWVGMNVMGWSQLVSFVLLSLLIVISFRSLVNKLITTFRYILHFNILTSKMIIIFFSWVFGVYTLYLVLLLRLSFIIPAKIKVFYQDFIFQDSSNMLFFERFSNIVFLVSSIVTIFVLYFIQKIERASVENS